MRPLSALIFCFVLAGCRPTPTPGLVSTPPTALPTPTPLPLDPSLLERLSEAATLLRSNDASALTALAALETDASRSAVLSEQLAGLYEELDFTDKIYVLARQATRLDPTYSPGFVRLGRLEQYLGLYNAAEKHLKEATKLAPGSSDAQLALGLLFKHQNKLAEAAQCLQAAQKADPTEWRLSVVLNQILVQDNKFDEALQVIEAARKLAPDKWMLVLQRAITLEEYALAQELQGKREEAMALRKEALPLAEQALLKLPEAGPPWFHLGKLRQGAGDLKGAIAAWEKAYSLSPDYLTTRNLLGQALLRQGQRERGAKILAENKAKKDQKERYQQLVLSLGQAPEDVAKRREFARFCVEHKLIPRAIFEWERVLEQQPSDAEAKREVAALKARRLKDMTQ